MHGLRFQDQSPTAKIEKGLQHKAEKAQKSLGSLSFGEPRASPLARSCEETTCLDDKDGVHKRQCDLERVPSYNVSMFKPKTLNPKPTNYSIMARLDSACFRMRLAPELLPMGDSKVIPRV